MAAIGDLVHQLTTVTGTGNATLSNVNGRRSFNTAFGNGVTLNVFYYYISNRDAAEWEVGTGHMSDATTLVRDTVLTSSNSNSLVSFSAGTKDVSNAVPASLQYYSSGTDVAIADGGTGASTAATAFDNLKQAATSSATGVVELADNTEALAGSDTTRAVTSAGLASAKTLATDGYMKLPGGVIIQWGSAIGAAGTTETFAVAFPSACRAVIATSGTANRLCTVTAFTPSDFTFTSSIADTNGASAASFTYMAIGY